MKRMLGILLAAGMAVVPLLAQEKGRGGPPGNKASGAGHIPTHGPPPAKVQPQAAAHPQETPRPQEAPRPPQQAARGAHGFVDKPGHTDAPHVHPNNQWVGHDSGKNDPRYHLDRPLNMGGSPAASARGMFSGWRVETASVSSSMGSTSAWRPPITISATIGCGTAIRL